jgi:polysaccharide pyruvyl transferase WcaK-like protein
MMDTAPKYISDFDKAAESVIKNRIFQDIKSHISSADLVLINGEGLMYRNNRYSRMALFIAYLSKVYFDTTCAIVNHTIDFQDDSFKKMVKKIYPLLDNIVFREPVSKEMFDSEFNGKKISTAVAADAAFRHSPTDHTDELRRKVQCHEINVHPYATMSFDPAQSYICLSGNSVYKKEEELELKGYKQLCKKLINAGKQLLLIVSAPYDEKLLRPLSKQFDLPIVGLNTTTSAAIDILANASVYVGGRYHPAIFAALGGTPIVPITPNTHKIRGLLRHLEIDPTIHGAFNILDEVEEIHDEIRSYSANKELQTDLKKRCKELSRISLKNIPV